jgi:hypothetical protein
MDIASNTMPWHSKEGRQWILLHVGQKNPRRPMPYSKREGSALQIAFRPGPFHAEGTWSYLQALTSEQLCCTYTSTDGFVGEKG